MLATVLLVSGAILQFSYMAALVLLRYLRDPRAVARRGRRWIAVRAVACTSRKLPAEHMGRSLR